MDETIYTPESHLRRPGLFFRESLAGLWASRELAWRLLIRNLAADYRQSVLGYLWLLLPPLATALVWIVLRASRIISFDDPGIPYPVFIITGVFLWQGFLKMLTAPMQQLANARHMLSKVKFPWEALVIAGAGEALFEFALYVLILVGVFVWFQIPWSLAMLLGVLGLVPLLLFGLALGLFLLPWSMLYSDVQKAVNVATMVLFFATPIVYPPPVEGGATWLVTLNPIAVLLVSARELLTGGPVSYPGLYFLVSGLTVLLLLVGWIIFRLAIPHLVARV